jgi:transposase
MLDKGYSYSEIADVLLFDESTARRYLATYQQNGLSALTSDNYQPYAGKLTEEQGKELGKYLDDHLFTDVTPIIDYVTQKYKAAYTKSGMRDLLHRIGFVHIKASHVPGKADPEKQREWLEVFQKLMAVKSPDTPVVYIDAVHPTFNSKPAYGWIRKGKKAEIPANSGRQRLNLNGAVNAETHEVIVTENQKMTGESTLELLRKIEDYYRNTPWIYVILDQAPYYDCQMVRDYCAKSRIRLIYLPAYSPNLNLIERLWRFMYKHTVNNRYFSSFADFRLELLCFFDRLPTDLFGGLRSLLTMNFSIVSDKDKRRTVII